MELSVRAVVLGSVLGLVFGAANAYLALKVGMTISASIPAAVMSMAILRGVMKKGTVLENNIVQTIGSSGEGLAAGVVFTIPAFFLLDLAPSQWTILAIAVLGGFLGILFMIPLRQALIVNEHATLPFPEGTACAQVLLAGDRGGSLASKVFIGVGIGGAYRLLVSGWKWGKETLTMDLSWLKGASLGAECSPALLAVGYIVGPRTAAIVCAGGFLGSLVLVPLIAFVGDGLLAALAPGTSLISQMSPGQIRGTYVRFIGAGAVAFGGVMSLLRTLPTLAAFFKKAPSQDASGRASAGADLPFGFVITSALCVIALIAVIPAFSLGIVGAVMVVVATFLFVAVSARIVGIIGSSSNPVSGMTIATLIATTLLFSWLGHTGPDGMRAALSVGAIVCMGICMAGDASQDLKTGFLVGATPWRQQIAEFIGVVVPALAMGWVILALHKTYGIGSEHLSAPQASLMATVVKGIMEGTMPWNLILLGAALALVVELLGVASLPFAIGLYLPIVLTLPMLMGGCLAWYVGRQRGEGYLGSDRDAGMLYGSGLIAGDALAGLGLTPLHAIPALAAWHHGLSEGWVLGDLGTMLAFFGIGGSLLWQALRPSKDPR